MRKNIALLLMAVLSLTLALALASCGQTAQESSTPESSMPPAEQTMPPSEGSMTADSMAADTGMAH